MRNVPCPCKQDCPNREVGCRSSCCKYKVYEVMKAKAYAKRKAEREVLSLDFAYQESFRKRLKQAKNRRPRFT